MIVVKRVKVSEDHPAQPLVSKLKCLVQIAC